MIHSVNNPFTAYADLLPNKVKVDPTTSQGFKSPTVAAAIAEIALNGP